MYKKHMQYDLETLRNYTVSSVPEGYDAFLLDKFARNSKKDILYVVSDGVELQRCSEVLSFLNPKLKVLSFPAWDTVPYDRVSPNVNIIAQRIDVLSELVLNPTPKHPRVVIASVGAVLQKLPPMKIFLNSSREVRVGGKLNFNDFLHYVSTNGYNRVEQVIEPGEYAVRGDIIDIFPVGTSEPLRIDLFDDEVERIRTFDAMSQRTTGETKSYNFKVMNEVMLDANTIKNFRAKYREAFGSAFNEDEIYEAVSNGKKYLGMENWLPFFYEENLPSLFDYMPSAYVIAGKNIEEAAASKAESIADYYQARLEALSLQNKTEIDAYRPVKPELMYLQPRQFVERLHQKGVTVLTPLSIPSSDNVINTEVIPGRNFSNAKNVAAGQVYENVKDYLSENKIQKVKIRK